MRFFCIGRVNGYCFGCLQGVSIHNHAAELCIDNLKVQISFGYGVSRLASIALKDSEKL